MQQIAIMPMQAQQVPAVAALERACFSAPWSENSLAGELDNSLACWLVAVCQGEVLGYVGSQAVGEEADVMNIAVAPAARGQGLGRALMQALMDQLQRTGVASLSLEVRPSNAAALALYEALGFVQVGCRPRYYRKPTEDAWILRREFLQGEEQA